jgi:hypothetical protein
MYDRDVLHLSFSQRWHYLFVSVNQRQLLNLSRQAALIPERASTRFFRLRESVECTHR